MALANISLTTIVATTATFAWFVNNKVVSASGIEMSISADTGVDLRYEVIKYDDDIKEGISFQGNAENFSLPKYDRYISYNHKYENAILRADVGFNAFDKTKELTIDITCSQPLFDVGSETNVAPKTSNVIQFKTSVISYTTDQLENNKYKLNQYIEDETGEDGFLTDAALSYETARTYFATQPIATSFVSAFNNTGSKYHYTVTCIPYIPNDTMLAGVHIQSAVIYIECSYNEEAVEYYINNHNENNSTDFDGDITSIKFGVTNHVNGGYERVTDLSTALTSGGEYLAVKNDGDEKIHKDYALDGSLEASNIGGKANFNQVDIKNDAISANSVIKQRDLNITNNDGAYYVRSQGANYLTKDSSSTQIASSSSGVSHSISNNELVLTDSNTYALAYRNSRGDDRFGYIASGTNKQSIEYFKYNGSYVAPVLTSITATPNKTLYSVGDSFKVSDVSVTATYSNGQTKNVTESCTYQGYDFSVSGTQTIYVYYSENNVTVSTDYQINVTSSPVVTLDKYEITLIHGDVAEQATIKATATKFTSEPLTYSWSIDNPSVLNITENGDSITVQTNAYGTATITCTVSDNDGHTAYNSCKVYVITSSTIWRLVTDASSLSVGDTVVIAAASLDYNYAMGDQSNNNDNRKQATVVKNDIDKTLSFSNEAGVVSFTIAKGLIANTYAFQTADSNYLYAASSSSNYLREKATLDADGSWRITIVDGVASIVAQGDNTRNTIKYNSASDLFSCYSSGQDDVAIYRLESGNALKSLSVSVDAAVPYPLKQYDGRKFDCPSGVTFNATYADGSTKKGISPSKIVFNGGAVLKFGDTMITASYTENGVTKSTIIDVNVHRIELESIAITGEATVKAYLSGSNFQPAGLKVTATFNFGTEDITNNKNLVWNGGNGLTVGQTSVTASFTYNNGESDTVKEATYNGITVVKKTLTSISVAKGYKETYAVGETFSFSSTVTAHFNEGDVATSDSTLTSDQYTIKVGSNDVGAVMPTFTESDIGTITVTISYTFEGVTKTFSYQITVSKDKDLVFTHYSGAITEGRYVIVSQKNSDAMTSTNESSAYTSSSVTITDSKITNPDNTIVWDILGNDDGTYSIKSVSTNNYIKRGSSTGTSLSSISTVGTGSKFTFADKGGGVYKINISNENREILCSSSSWKYYATSNFNGTSYERPTLYKLGGYTPTTITNVTLNTNSETLNSSAPSTGTNSNKTVQLTATVTGTGDVSQDVTWTSSDDTIATVDQNGLVTAVNNVKNNTTVTITAESSQDSTKIATCTITVKAATTISIAEKPTQLFEGGKTGTITANITAGWDSSSNTANDISWTSGNSSILRVTGNGLTANLTTVNVDTNDTPVKITATLPNGNSASCDILVKNSAPSTIAFDEAKSTTKLASGNNGSVVVNITAGDDYEDSMHVTFESKNTSVLTIGDSVKNGTTVTCSITAVSAGSATITAKLVKSNGTEVATATLPINVTAAQTSVEKTSFSALEDDLDTVVSYSSSRGGGTSAPQINNGEIRLYQNADGATGGYIVISCKAGYRITEVIIGSSMATTTGYYLSNSEIASAPNKSSFVVSNYSLPINGKYTVTGINTQYIAFACFGKDKNSRLYVNYLKVTYVAI